MPGCVLDRRALHQKALELDPRHCCAYRDLALALRPKETVLLQGGTAGQCHGNVGRRELLLEAIRLEPSSAENYRLLAETLQKDEELMLNGFQMGKTQVFVRSLELDVDPVTCAQLGVHLGPDSCRVKGWSSPASWFSGAAEEGDNSWTGTQLIKRALQLAPTRPDVLMAAATFELERPRADRTKARQLLLVAVAQGGRPNVAAAAGRLALLMEPGEAVRIPSQEGGATAVRRQLLLAACEEVDDAQLLTELALELLRSAPEVQLRGRTFDVRALCREALILDPHHSMAQQLLSHETKRTSPKPLLLRSAAPDLIQSSKDWQEPGFAPADAPKELDRFVLALVALEANKHEGALADALGELMGPADRVRLSEGQDGTASRYWQYRSRSQLHQAALEADPSSSRTWTNLGVTTEEINFQGCLYNREAMFQRALELDPQNTAAATNLAFLRGSHGRCGRSCQAWPRRGGRRMAGEVKQLVESSLTLQEKACRLQPRCARRRLRLANSLADAAENDILETQKLHGLRLSHLQEAFHLDADDADVCHQLGIMLFQTDTTLRWNEGSWTAESLLSRALMLKPQAPDRKSVV